jgi:ubiquinone/menaquinone biosynthesis C-methylase UbiE
VLEIGCGTGRHIAALASREGCRVWGVDPSAEMLAVARARAPRGVGLKQAHAEALPFGDGWFERAAMRLVIHLLDRPRAFDEARRVLGIDGALAVVTFDPSHFDRYWLNTLFPSLEVIDRARFPSRTELESELLDAGFTSVRLIAHRQHASLDRATALAKIRGRHISTFDLLADEEYRAGLERAEREVPERVDYVLDWLVAVAERTERPQVGTASDPSRGRLQ